MSYDIPTAEEMAERTFLNSRPRSERRRIERLMQKGIPFAEAVRQEQITNLTKKG